MCRRQGHWSAEAVALGLAAVPLGAPGVAVALSVALARVVAVAPPHVLRPPEARRTMQMRCGEPACGYADREWAVPLLSCCCTSSMVNLYVVCDYQVGDFCDARDQYGRWCVTANSMRGIEVCSSEMRVRLARVTVSRVHVWICGPQVRKRGCRGQGTLVEGTYVVHSHHTHQLPSPRALRASVWDEVGAVHRARRG